MLFTEAIKPRKSPTETYETSYNFQYCPIVPLISIVSSSQEFKVRIAPEMSRLNN